MGGVSDNVNKYCRVYSGAGLKVKDIRSIVKNCLFALPSIWVRIVKVFIYCGCLMILNVAQFLVGECQPLLRLFISAEQTMLCSAL